MAKSNPQTPDEWIAYRQEQRRAQEKAGSSPTPSAYTAPGSSPTQSATTSPLGSQYQNLAGTNYYSTNAGNPNAAYYYADGSPVANVGFTSADKQKVEGFTSKDNFNNILNQGDASKQYAYMQNLANNGQIQTLDSIASMSKDPRYGLPGGTPRQITYTPPQGMSASTSAGTTSSGGATPQALTASQQSAQDYITKAGKWGTLQDYVSNNIDRYNRGEITYQALVNDAQRVGYSIPSNQEVNTSSYGSSNTSNSSGTPQSYIDQLNNAKLNATLAALGKSRDAALSNLNSEKSAIQPKYYDARNQVASGAQQQARNFAEYMAARGGTSSGTNAQAELARNMSTQGNLGTLGRQEAQAYTDVARRTSDLQNAYQSDVANANAGIEADRMNALLNQYNTDRQMEIQLAQLLGRYNGQTTLAGQQQAYNQMSDTRNYDYQVGRDQVSDSQWKQQFDQDVSRYGEQMAYQKARDKITDAQEKKRFDEDVRQFGIQMGVQKYNAETSRMSENRIGSQSSTPSSNLTSKDSADNAAAIRAEIENEKLSKTDAVKFLQGNASALSDSDYNKMMTYINSMK